MKQDENTENKMNNSYIILPLSGDLNRGDQALVWCAKELIEAIDDEAICYAISNAGSTGGFEQSEKEGLRKLPGIVLHPGRKDSDSGNNIRYSKSLMIKWGFTAIGDLIKSLFLLSKPTRNLAKRFYCKEAQETISKIESATSFFVKGGGFMHTYGGMTAPYTIYYNMYNILLALRMGKRVYILPNSFGPFNDRIGTWILKYIIKNSRLCCCRETTSKMIVKEELKIDLPVFPDMGFLLKKEKCDYNLKAIAGDKKIVAITARPYRFPYKKNGEQLYKKYIMAMGEFAEYLISNGYYVFFVEHTIAIRAHESDIAAISEIKKNLRDNNSYSIISDSTLSCRNLKYIYSQCDYVIGTRFHSDIFSMAENVPAIAISYEGYKSTGIMKDIGLEDYCVEMSSVTAEELERIFNHMVENSVSIKQKLSEYMRYVEDKYNELIQEIELED